jgi:hypothetical protein
MAADKTGFLQSDHFLARDRPAWWDAEEAHTFDEDETLTVADGLGRTGLDFEVSKRPNKVEYKGQMVETGSYSVVRPPVSGDDQVRIFKGTVGENYEPIQNSDIASILDPIAEDWPLETIGGLRHGQKIFVVLDSGTYQVGPEDEEVDGYFLVTDDKAGNQSLRVSYTPTRVVCMNTLRVALSKADMTINVQHTSNVEEELDFYAQVMKNMQEGQEAAHEAMDEMARSGVQTGGVQEVLDHTYPEPNMNDKARIGRQIRRSVGDSGYSQEQKKLALDALQRWEKRRDRQKELRDIGFKAYQAFNERNPNQAETAWAAYNAVAESESWRPGKNESTRGRAALLGSRAGRTAKAFEASLGLVD